MHLSQKQSTTPAWTRCLARPNLVRIIGVLLTLIVVLSPWGFSFDVIPLPHDRINKSNTKVIHEEPSPSATYKDAPTSIPTSAAPPFTVPPMTMSEFWGKLANALSAAEPEGETIVSPNPLAQDTFNPFGKNPIVNLDVLRLPAEQFQSLKRNHSAYVRSIRHLAPHIPFRSDTRGVVITAKGDKFGVAVTAILMMRRVGSKLPVQLFLNDASEYERKLCNKSLAKMDVQCLSIDDFLQLPDNAPAPELQRFQFKVFSIIFSTFQHILFLDADAFPIRNPDYLFDVEPYKTNGLVTWPDFWIPTISPLFYEIAGVKTPNNTLASRASESGILLYDKARHAESLLLAAYYNFYGRYYFQLHSQGAWGSGDKETFLQAAMVLGEPYWQVKTNAWLMTPDDVNWGTGIWQADPELDWKRHTAVKEDGVPVSTRLFAHLNKIKFDARQLSWLIGGEDEDGNVQWSRTLGPDKEGIVKMAGYDLEKVIWEEVIKINCDGSLLVECERIQAYYERVFKHG
ncbi:hypothetical protein ACJ41O_005656 [Fusarium nematophilum]